MSTKIFVTHFSQVLIFYRCNQMPCHPTAISTDPNMTRMGLEAQLDSKPNLTNRKRIFKSVLCVWVTKYARSEMGSGGKF